MYHEANNIIGGLISIQLKNENFRFFEMSKYPKKEENAHLMKVGLFAHQNLLLDSVHIDIIND